MKKCRFCAEEILDEAKVCKHCGREQKPKKGFFDGCGTASAVLLGLCLLGFVLFMGWCATTCAEISHKVSQTPAQPTATPDPNEARLGKLGYCPGQGLPGLGFTRIREAPPCPVELYLGQTLKDPSSYEGPKGPGARACSTTAGKKAWIVDCTFRAKNSFGALVPHAQRFQVLNGKVIKTEALQ